MDVNDYRKYLINECISTAQSQETTADEEFIRYMINLFVDNEEALELNECYFEMQGPRNRKIQIDGWGFDDADNSFMLFISVFDAFFRMQTLTNLDIEGYLRKLEAFVENAASGYIEENSEFSSEGRQVAATLRRYLENDHIVKFKFYIISNVPLSKAVKNVSKENVLGKEVLISIWDLERIYKSDVNNQQKEDISINVDNYVKGGLKCIQAFEEENDEYTAYLCVIPGTMLSELYNEYGSLLLEGNVRSFLSMTGKVNKGIRNTIINQPTFFFTYNNGIATTAKDVVVKNDKIVQITNLQIINGGQTTASIFFTKYTDKNNLVDLSKVFVPMKLTVVKNQEKYQEVIEKISRYSNTQNKVSDSDFFSNSNFHVEFKKYSQTIYAPVVQGQLHNTRWFYERVKGSYKQEQLKLTQAQIKKFKSDYPKEQLITKTDLAKYYNCYLKVPHIVSKGAQFNMKAFAEYYEKYLTPRKSDVINAPSKIDEKFFKDCIALAIIFRQTDKLVQKQEWYINGNGYKANIVAYAMSKLFDLVQAKYVNKKLVNLSKIWATQSMYPELKNFMIILSKEAYEHLTDPKRGIGNVTEWAKKKECWESFKAKDIPIPFDFEMSLISVEEDLHNKHVAKADKKITSDVEAQIEVVNKGPEFWKKLLDKCFERNIHINPTQEQDLRTAISMYKKRPPNSFESKRLLKFLEYVQGEGVDIEKI